MKQGKRFYQRVKNLEENGIIQVFREVGEPNLYRLTDLGLRRFWETNF
jgi:chromosome segregation and condensation protein ScpB